MLDNARSWFGTRVEAIRTALSSKTHFNFITVHYAWIVGATLLGSILIWGGGRGSSDTEFIDSLLLASGANTQAGLNPVDVNSLNTFQQVVIYLLTMLSNPITLNGSVVVLRLYWFEKRFRGWVKDARQRRGTLSKAKSRARDEALKVEEGVNGRHITVVPHVGLPPRMTNDGILLDRNVFQSQAIVDDDDEHLPGKPAAATSSESDSATVSAARSNSMELGPTDMPEQAAEKPEERQWHRFGERPAQPTPTAITFADTVKRSDGMDNDQTKFPQKRSHAEHIAILERQRNQDSEVLRIPGPRETERGVGPTRLGENDAQDDEHDDNGNGLEKVGSGDSRSGHLSPQFRRPPNRRPTIVIAEPERPVRDKVAENAEAAAGVMSSLRMRKPRIFNRGQKQTHEDNESTGPVRVFRARTLETLRSVVSRDKTDDMPYLSYTPTTARNSNFVGLTLEQREELGGIEYRSLRTLALILLVYFFGFHAIAITCLVPFIHTNNHYGKIVDAAGQSRTWWGFFTANSAFMDLGFTLTPDSMNSFSSSDYTMMVLWFFIIIGNTGFPVMLRFLIWISAQIVPRGTGMWEELRFLLDHPRRCFTLLFPSSANWWLFWILVGLNAIDLLFFMVLDFNSAVVKDAPTRTQVADGLFQAASTRTAGFSCYNMSGLHPAMPVLYMIMMYISVFPIAISIRRTNVYEEKSLGVYHSKNAEDDDMEAPALSYVGTHLRRQLSFDLWYVFVGFFFLAISEGDKLKAGDFDLFAILFEVISAYGTVGLSMGAKGVNASLCSQFNIIGKLIICAMQIRGRHRGLPYGLDRAVLLPSESRFEKEAVVEQPALVRTRTGVSTAASGVDVQGGQSIASRRRSTSRGRERPSVITQLLHPGPAYRDGTVYAHRRTGSTASQNFPRTTTAPVPDNDADEPEHLRTVVSHNHDS